MKLVKEKLIENIRELLKMRGIKIGDLEQRIGVSPGYFSRILKEGRDIPIEHIVTVAEMLQVSIDNLLFGDFLPRYNRIKKVCEYLDKLIVESMNGKIKWKKGSVDEFEAEESDISMPFEVFLTCNKNYEKIRNYYRGKCQDNREFLLLFVANNIEQFEGCFLDVVYWTKILRDSNEDYELEPNFIDIFLPVHSKSEVVKVKIQELVECIEKCMKDIPVSIEAQMEIDAFLNE